MQLTAACWIGCSTASGEPLGRGMRHAPEVQLLAAAAALPLGSCLTMPRPGIAASSGTGRANAVTIAANANMTIIAIIAASTYCQTVHAGNPARKHALAKRLALSCAVDFGQLLMQHVELVYNHIARRSFGDLPCNPLKRL